MASRGLGKDGKGPTRMPGNRDPLGLPSHNPEHGWRHDKRQNGCDGPACSGPPIALFGAVRVDVEGPGIYAFFYYGDLDLGRNFFIGLVFW